MIAIFADEAPGWPALQAGQPPAAPALTPAPQTIEPLHQISLTKFGHPFDVHFSPDGRFAYCLLDAKLVDPVAAGLGSLTYVLGAVLVLIVLAYLYVVLWVVRRPQIAGAPHCRRCNYDVRAQAPDAITRPREVPPDMRCPECGILLAKARPRRGRTLRRRLALPTTVTLMCTLGIVWFLASWNSPSARAAGLGFWSPLLDRAAERLEIQWLLEHRTDVTRLVRIDLESGLSVRELRILRGAAPRGMLVMPDGHHLIIEDQSGSLHCLRTRSGRLAATMNRLGPIGPSLSSIAGHATERQVDWVYYSDLDENNSHSLLMRWQPRTGERHIVMDEPAPDGRRADGSTGPIARRYSLFHTTIGVVVVAASDEPYGGGRLTVYEPGSWGAKVDRSIIETFPRTSRLVLHPNLGMAFFTMRRRGVFAYDLARAGFLDTRGMDLFGPEFTNDELALSPRGEWLFVGTTTASVLVWDLTSRRWRARLQCPTGYNGPAIAISPDGRWLAAVPLRTTPRKGTHGTSMFLFEMRAIRNQASGQN